MLSLSFRHCASYDVPPADKPEVCDAPLTLLLIKIFFPVTPDSSKKSQLCCILLEFICCPHGDLGCSEMKALLYNGTQKSRVLPAVVQRFLPPLQLKGQGHKEGCDMKESDRTVLESGHDSLVTLWLLGCV